MLYEFNMDPSVSLKNSFSWLFKSRNCSPRLFVVAVVDFVTKDLPASHHFDAVATIELLFCSSYSTTTILMGMGYDPSLLIDPRLN